MIKWLVRIVVISLALTALLAGGATAYFCYQGSAAMDEATAAGWFDPKPDDKPLNTLETIAAKALFGDTWNDRPLPCRSIVFAVGRHGKRGWAVSESLRLGIQSDRPNPGYTIEANVRRLALECFLEASHGDADLLRIWMRRAYYGDGVIGAESAAKTLFRKLPDELNEMEAAKLVALLDMPLVSKQPEVWDIRAQIMLDRAALYHWDGTTMTRTEAGDAQ